LADAGVKSASVRVPAVSVRAGTDEIQAIDVSVTMPTAASAANAAAALRRLASPAAMPRSRTGAGARRASSGKASLTPAAPVRSATGDDKKRPLSYPGAAMVHVEIAAQGTKPAVVEISRSDRPKGGPLPARPGSDAKEKVTLANLYTNDG